MVNKIKHLIKDNLKYKEYIDIYNKINSIKVNDLYINNLNIAILRSYTCDQIKEILTVESFKEDYYCNLFIGGYNQYAQEILDSESELYKFNPEIIIMAIRLEEFVPEIYEGYAMLNDKINQLTEEIINSYENLINVIKERTKANILIHNFVTPVYSQRSLYDYNNKSGLINFVRNLNLELLKLTSRYTGIYIVDVEEIASIIGKENIIDKKMWYIAKNPYKINFYINISKEYIKYIKAINGNLKKCIVLDLDNTLWGGIVGEDGFSGIKLSDNYPGRCYKDFQIELKKLKDRGVILAISSKNNYEDAIEVINKHPDMILREQDFASLKINWNDKATNISDIASELNIGIESIVFIDDNIAECELIKQAFNGKVEVVNLSSNVIEYVDIINQLNYFNTLKITKEDMNKTEIYKKQIERTTFMNSYNDIEKYYESLEMIAEIEEVDEFSVTRISQLTQKTNQFNMTTRRYTQEDIHKMKISGDYKIYYLKVTDRFGDNGIVGVCIIKETNGNEWCIDTFLLSCRVMKRTLEYAFMSYIYSKAVENGVENLIGEYIPNNKNSSVRNFYNDLGFTKISDSKYILSIKKNRVTCPYYITIE